MKKIAIILAALMLLSALPLTASAWGTWIIENDPIISPKATPTIDGVISEDEGWSDPARFDDATVGHFWAHNMQTSSGLLYFAYNDEGLYFAADMSERHHREDDVDFHLDTAEVNTFIYSTDFDDVNFDDDSTSLEPGQYRYGWNGDVLTLMVDPFGALGKASTGGGDYSPWYNFGLFKDAETGEEYVRAYRSWVNFGEITDLIEVDGRTVERPDDEDGYPVDGWQIEAFIPWEMIAEDVDMISFGDVTPTVKELSAVGAKFEMAVMHLDRYFDPESEIIDTWARLITVTEEGIRRTGVHVGTYGLHVTNGQVKHNFIDLPDGKWFTDPCLWCYSKGYMSGTSATTFSPNVVMTRAQFVQILAKIDGAELEYYKGKPFEDVPLDKWYSKAVDWAYQSGYAGGTGNGNFSPDASVTRETLAQFFYTYAKDKGYVSGQPDLSVLDKFTDASEIAGWAKEAMAWAVGSDLISGTTATTVAPKATATRATVAVIVSKFVDNIASSK